PERLAGRLGYVGSAFGLGFVVGPAVRGLLARPELGAAGLRPPLLLGSGLALLAAVGMLMFVRESRAGRRVGPATHPFAALAMGLRHPVLAPMLGAIFLAFMAFSGLWSVLGLWGGARFGWSARDLGLVMALIGLVSAIDQGPVTA